MARSRNIKPGFLTNADLIECPFEMRILFAGLWMFADREGRLKDKPKQLKINIFPGDDVDVDLGLDTLEGKGFLRRYQVDGGRYIEIQNFSKHQNPHHREPPSEIPEPPQDIENKEASESPRQDQGKTEESRADSGFLIPDSLNLIPDSSSSEHSDSHTVAELPLNDGTEFLSPPEFISEMVVAYPKLDIPAEIIRMRAWLIANPSKRKTRRGIKRFIGSWLSRARPTAEIHQFPMTSRHSGFSERDYTSGLTENSDGTFNF